MSEEEAAPQADEVESTEAEASAETEKTEKKAENMIPQSRFSEVVRERNEAREAISRLEQRLSKIESGEVKEERRTTGDISPPEGLSQIQQIQWYVEHFSGPHAKKIIEKELGMPLAEAKSKLSESATASKTAQELKWEKACERQGLDPNSREVQGIAMGLSNAYGDESVDKILERVSKYLGKQKNQNGSNGASVESGGISGVVTASDWLPKDTNDALEGAKKGKLAKQLSSVEIIERARARERGK